MIVNLSNQSATTDIDPTIVRVSPESRYSDFKSSIKKYLIDNLYTTSSIELFFNWIEDIPVDAAGDKLSQWIIVTFGAIEHGTVAECIVELNLFTRNDFEGDSLASLFDTVMEYFYDDSKPNGLRVVPYYNTAAETWTLVGGIIPFVERIFEDAEAKDNTKIKTIHLLCKWGSK